MSLGRKSDQATTEDLFISYSDLPKGPSHPFFSRLDKILRKYDFDAFCEELCEPFYAEVMGRPSIPPGVYFRMLMIGYFEGIKSERGIAWRVADSKSLEGFLGYKVTEGTPDHSSLSRIRYRLSLEAHKQVFAKVLEILKKEKLLKGKKIGLDASNVEANAAMRSIRRKIDGKRYEAYLKALAKQSGIEEPTKEELSRFDRNRPNKSCSNKEWENPNDPEAKVTKMKDGRTHLAYKAEHSMDLETSAMVSVVIHPADRGDTESGWETLAEASENLNTVQEGCLEEEEILQECVADRGYHSGSVLLDMEQVGIRSYIAEPDRGRRKWKGKRMEQQAVYANRNRMKRAKAKGLQRKRAEILERSFAHMLDSGGMRRVWLRGRENVWKRYLIHACAFNLSLVMRKLYRAGTPRGLEALVRLLLRKIFGLLCSLRPIRLLSSCRSAVFV
jgi:transposase